MDLTAWVLYLFIAGGLLAASLLHYRRREPSGRGRRTLAVLRGLALAIIVLLVFDPMIPGAGAARRAPTVALVDASLSMRLQAPDGATRWEEALAVLAELRPDQVLLFGSGEARPALDPGAVQPDEPRTLAGPALRSALEAGVGRVVLLTDGAVEDADETARLARDAQGRVTVRRVGARTAWNTGLVELEGPSWARIGEEAEIRAGVARVGEDPPDSLTLLLRWEHRELARVRVATPQEGQVSSGALRFVPPEDMAGRTRLDVALEDGGSETDDDERSLYVEIADESAGAVLVSFEADQEPRFLLPVVERALGIPVRGWLALGGERYIRLGAGPEAGLADGPSAVRATVEAADLVILHGIDGQAPAWARTAAGTRPALLFPRGALDGLPVRLGPLEPGEWYAWDQIPPSPVASFVAGVPSVDVPPLRGVRAADVPPGWWAPLMVWRDRRGDPAPLLVAGEADGRRVAIALGEGYWRWAFSEGRPRVLYDALWSAVAGWLLEEAGGVQPGMVGAAARVVPRGEALRWAIPPNADSVRIALQPLAGGEPVDSVVVAAEGEAVLPPLRPGHYRYQAEAYLGGGETAAGAGELTVERYSSEFTRPARLGEPDDEGEAGRVAVPGDGRSLRTMVWPYVALLALLCAEWVLRRRWGLR
jgi:hypothetical protein